jgi:hypothetical protein
VTPRVRSQAGQPVSHAGGAAAIGRRQQQSARGAEERMNAAYLRGAIKDSCVREGARHLSRDELEVAPGAELATEGCARLARPRAPGSSSPASAALDQRDLK